jgi:Tfp pilus assembly protein PilF
MRAWPALLFALFLAGCATAPTPVEQGPNTLFRDRLFTVPSERIRASDVFAVSSEMKQYLGAISDQLDTKGRQRGLYDALYTKDQLRLEYDAAMTRNASEAFAGRTGNCLSLVIMTAALAKELGLAVYYQRVISDETWSRTGDTWFSSGHVNVTLGKKPNDPRVLFNERTPLTIDFIPLAPNQGQYAWPILEETVVAMFMNNRAAEAMTRGNLNDAYWWAREAIARDSRFLAAYNTLGVIYRRHGNLAEAEQAFQYVLVREAANTFAMSNLVIVYDEQGRAAESKALARKLAQIQPFPPFYYFDKGLAAMQAKDFKTARDLFAKEVERDSYYHEFHFWLAAAYVGLGDIQRAQRHLTIAMENSTTRGEHDLYAAKLGRIASTRAR